MHSRENNLSFSKYFLTLTLLGLVGIYSVPLVMSALFFSGLERDIPSWMPYQSEIRYNTLLKYHDTLTESERAQYALTIASDPPGWYEWESLELLWDISHTHSGALWEVKDLYRRAYAYHPLPRIEKKLSLLSGDPPSVSPPLEIPTHTSSGTTDFASGELVSLSEARDRIFRDSGHRGQYLGPLQGYQKKNILRDTIDFLDTGKEMVDW